MKLTERHLDRLAALSLLLICAAACAPVFFFGRIPNFVDMDGYFYYLPALFRGHPFDLSPLLHSGLAVYPPTGRVGNLFGVGMAIIWLPFYAVARLLFPHAALDAAPMWQACSLGTYTVVAVGMVFLYYALRHFVRPLPAFLSALVTFVGAPLIAYTAHQPHMSHGASFAFVSLLLWLAVARSGARARHWVAAGLLCGLCADLRPQMAVFALVPILLWPRNLKGLGAFAVAALVAFAPQMIMWQGLYGAPIVNPHVRMDPGFFRTPQVLAGLFSPRHGLFLWSPALLVSFVGLVWAAARDWHRKFALLAIALIAYSAVINTAPWIWWAGASFGGRRFCDTLPLFAVGAAYLWSRTPWVALAYLPAVYWNLLLLWAWLLTWTHPSALIIWPASPLTVPIVITIVHAHYHGLAAFFSAPGGIALICAVLLVAVVSALRWRRQPPPRVTAPRRRKR